MVGVMTESVGKDDIFTLESHSYSQTLGPKSMLKMCKRKNITVKTSSLGKMQGVKCLHRDMPKGWPTQRLPNIEHTNAHIKSHEALSGSEKKKGIWRKLHGVKFFHRAT